MLRSERRVAYIFPGQGVQKGVEPDQVSVQLAVVTNSCDLLNYSREQNPQVKSLIPDCYAGHSVGMWSAMHGADMINYQKLLESVGKRAMLMERVGSGRMTAILGRDWDEAKEVWLREGVNLAAINCPGQFVISGRENNVVSAEMRARELGMRVLPLQTVGPNHSDLMREIQPEFRKYIEGLDLRRPEGLILLNSSALPSRSVDKIREETVAHLSKTVFWEKSVRNMILVGVNIFVEWGSNTLSNLIGRIDSTVQTISITSFEEAESLRV